MKEKVLVVVPTTAGRLLLLKEVFSVARKENCKRLRWQFLEWNTPAIEFYKSLKANIDTEWYNCDFGSEEMNVL